ncbi:hypothetical protein HDE_13162 [Halotydeus destructor]|nr:hypothetical protein HDE_13162 [Halotydeus destructor]
MNANTVLLILVIAQINPLLCDHCTDPVPDSVVRISNAVYAFKNDEYIKHTLPENSKEVSPNNFSGELQKVTELLPNISPKETVIGVYEKTLTTIQVFTTLKDGATSFYVYEYSLLSAKNQISFNSKSKLSEIYSIGDEIQSVNGVISLPNGNLIILHKDKDKLVYTSFSSTGTKISSEISNHTLVPTSMTAISDNIALSFYGQFYSIDKLQDVSSSSWLQDTSNIRFSARWLSCPVDLCNEVYLDAAANYKGKTMLFKDNYVWTYEDFPESKPSVAKIPEVYNKVAGPLSAAFHDKERLYLIKEKHVTVIQDGRQERKYFTDELFGPHSRHIQAATTVDNEAIIFFGCCHYQRFNLSQTFPFSRLSGLRSLIRFQGLFKDIDAALVDKDDVITLFKDNFRAKFHSEGLKTDIAQQLFIHTAYLDTFYRCEDKIYSSYQNIIGVHNFQSWADYQDKRPKPAVITEQDILDSQPSRSTTVSGSTDKISVSTNERMPVTSRKKLPLIAVSVVILASLIITICCFLVRRNSAKPYTYDFTTVETTPSIGMPSTTTTTRDTTKLQTKTKMAAKLVLKFDLI